MDTSSKTGEAQACRGIQVIMAFKLPEKPVQLVRRDAGFEDGGACPGDEGGVLEVEVLPGFLRRPNPLQPLRNLFHQPIHSVYFFQAIFATTLP